MNEKKPSSNNSTYSIIIILFNFNIFNLKFIIVLYYCDLQKLKVL